MPDGAQDHSGLLGHLLERELVHVEPEILQLVAALRVASAFGRTAVAELCAAAARWLTAADGPSVINPIMRALDV